MIPDSNETTLIPGAEPHSAVGGAELGEPIPAYMTWALAGAWIAIYLAMVVAQGQFEWRFGMFGPGAIDARVAHDFGAMTAREVAKGEVWRTITATFVHFSLLHLICNLSCLIPMGRVLESWYGAAQFLCVYLVIGAVGNGLAVLGRYGFGQGLDVPCGGGSSVMFGLIALVAVVGWRSKTRFGDFVRRKMMGTLLIFGVVVGVIGRKMLDNYGHGGGALAGAAVGFSHRYLIRWWDRKMAIVASSVAASIVLVACASAQWTSGSRDYRARRSAELARVRVAEQGRHIFMVGFMLKGVQRVVGNYEQMALIIEHARGPYKFDPTLQPRKEILAGIIEINQAREFGVPGGDEARYARWQELAELASKRQPPSSEILEFRDLSKRILRSINNELTSAITAAQAISRRPAGDSSRPR